MALIEMFFTQTATITPFVRMGSGKPIYGQAETRRCRMERGKKLQNVYKNLDGTADEIVANARMFCTGDPIPSRSIVQCDGQEFTVIDCDVMNGFADHHLEVYLE